VSCAGTALLIADETEQTQGIEFTRVAREHGAIDRLRLGEPAHVMLSAFACSIVCIGKSDVSADDRRAPLDI
jgi:hypothetical protein